MKFSKPISIAELAQMTGARPLGDTTIAVQGINEIHKVENGDITYVDHPKYYAKALGSAATVIFIDRENDCPKGKCLMVCDDPFSAWNFISKKYTPFLKRLGNISSSAVIGDGSVIQPGAVIGNEVIIGANCFIHSNVVIYDRCVLGNNVVIHAGASIGSDAFYYKKQEGKYTRMHSCGRVVIHDDVEIGANCTIDRGVSSDTVIGQGTKMDNLVHVGHDTVIGKNCLFAAQVGIAGVVTIEDDVILWGQVGVQKDLRLGKGSVVLGQSGVGKNLEPGKTYFGSPSKDAMERIRELAFLKRLPEVFEKLK